MKEVDGTVISSVAEQVKRWTEHFSSVLSRVFTNSVQPIPSEAPEETNPLIHTAPPSKDEIVAAIKALTNNKALGLDETPAELLQAALTSSSELLHLLIIEAWTTESFPHEWKKRIIVKLPKKRNLKKCENWMGICVLPAVAKTVPKIILERIREHLQAHLIPNKQDFALDP